MRNMDISKIGDRIKEQRDKIGHVQDGLSKKAGISQKTLSTWERGNLKSPKLSVFVDICNALGCDADYLLSGIDYTTHQNVNVSSQTGLSNGSIENLKRIKETEIGTSPVMSTLNMMLENEDFIDLLSAITDYRLSLVNNLLNNADEEKYQLFCLQEDFKRILQDVSNYQEIKKRLRDAKNRNKTKPLFKVPQHRTPKKNTAHYKQYLSVKETESNRIRDLESRIHELENELEKRAKEDTDKKTSSTSKRIKRSK